MSHPYPGGFFIIPVVPGCKNFFGGSAVNPVFILLFFTQFFPRIGV